MRKSAYLNEDVENLQIVTISAEFTVIIPQCVEF